MSRFGTYLSSGNREKEKEQIYYARFLFIYFKQTLVQITIFFHIDVNILNMITLCCIYIYVCIYTHTRNTFLKYILFSLQINRGGAVRHVTAYIWWVYIHFCDTLNLFTERKLKWQKATSYLFSLWLYINKSRPFIQWCIINKTISV